MDGEGLYFVAIKRASTSKADDVSWDLGPGNGVDSGWKAVTEGEAERMIRTALDRGINFYDSPNYGNGTRRNGWARCSRPWTGVDRNQLEVWAVGQRHRGFWVRAHPRLSGTQLETVERRLPRFRHRHSPPREFLDGNKNDHYEILGAPQEEGRSRMARLDAEDEIRRCSPPPTPRSFNRSSTSFPGQRGGL